MQSTQCDIIEIRDDAIKRIPNHWLELLTDFHEFSNSSAIQIARPINYKSRMRPAHGIARRKFYRRLAVLSRIFHLAPRLYLQTFLASGQLFQFLRRPYFIHTVPGLIRFKVRCSLQLRLKI